MKESDFFLINSIYLIVAIKYCRFFEAQLLTEWYGFYRSLSVLEIRSDNAQFYVLLCQAGTNLTNFHNYKENAFFLQETKK